MVVQRWEKFTGKKAILEGAKNEEENKNKKKNIKNKAIHRS